MGGIIEDKIFEALRGKRMTVREVHEGIRTLRPSYERTYGVIDKHMRKMYRLRQLNREQNSIGRYEYWNPAMEGRN